MAFNQSITPPLSEKASAAISAFAIVATDTTSGYGVKSVANANATASTFTAVPLGVVGDYAIASGAAAPVFTAGVHQVIAGGVIAPGDNVAPGSQSGYAVSMGTNSGYRLGTMIAAGIGASDYTTSSASGDIVAVNVNPGKV